MDRKPMPMDWSMVELFERIDRTVGETICIPLSQAKFWKATHVLLLAEVDHWDQESARLTLTGSDATTVTINEALDPPVVTGGPGREEG